MSVLHVPLFSLVFPLSPLVSFAACFLFEVLEVHHDHVELVLVRGGQRREAWHAIAIVDIVGHPFLGLSDLVGEVAAVGLHVFLDVILQGVFLGFGLQGVFLDLGLQDSDFAMVLSSSNHR